MSTEATKRGVTAEGDERFEIALPEVNGSNYDQDQEWCEVEIDGERRRIRFHDYHEIYSIPGLYEQIFYEELECDSPRTVSTLLAGQLGMDDIEPADLRILDVGAGNGMVGEELKKFGAGKLVGIDIIEEAAEAAERDRPDVYEEYFVCDLTDLPPDSKQRLREYDFNCMVTVAALGFGDIPPEAFTTAYNLVGDGGLIGFNIKEDFIDDRHESGFSRMIRRALDDGTMKLEAQARYQHRLSVAGEPLYYVAMIARKQRDL
jgi:predicted TPR repeat methyltransferase